MFLLSVSGTGDLRCGDQASRKLYGVLWENIYQLSLMFELTYDISKMMGSDWSILLETLSLLINVFPDDPRKLLAAFFLPLLHEVRVLRKSTWIL